MFYQDLAYTLRDGVLLCHIAVTLDPMSIDPKNVNQRPQMAQFLCLKNIRAFLQSCATKFGIHETDLFQPSMLYDYSDFAR
jgi:guanine nucleotide exchange factor VAV